MSLVRHNSVLLRRPSHDDTIHLHRIDSLLLLLQDAKDERSIIMMEERGSVVAGGGVDALDGRRRPYGAKEKGIIEENRSAPTSIGKCTACIRRLVEGHEINGQHDAEARLAAAAALGDMLANSLRGGRESALVLKLERSEQLPSHLKRVCATTEETQHLLDECRRAIDALCTRSEALSDTLLHSSVVPGCGEGGALLLALGLERLCSDAVEDDQGSARCILPAAVLDTVGGQVLRLLESVGPTVVTMHCCTLALSLAATHQPVSQHGERLLPEWALDAAIAALEHGQGGQLNLWDVLARLGKGVKGGVCGFEIAGLAVPTELTHPPRMVPRAQAYMGDESSVSAARDVWSACVKLAAGAPKDDRRSRRNGSSSERGRGGVGGYAREGDGASVHVAAVSVLQHLRRRLAAAKGNGGAQVGLGRAAVGLVEALGFGSVDADVLGHVLPMCFAMVEEYGEEDVMLQGYLLWLHTAHFTTPTELTWHLAINAKVFERCLKVLRSPAVLRVCMFAMAELLRLCRPPQPQELERMRASVVEELVGALARATEAPMRFVLLEGLMRVMNLYVEGYLLVRWLRPLTQVILAQLQEGDDVVRLAGLEAMLRMLPLCEPMLFQHAHESMAQVARVYMLVKRSKRHRPLDERTLSMCREVAVRLEAACRGKVDLAGFVCRLEEKGCRDLEGLLSRQTDEDCLLSQPD